MENNINMLEIGKDFPKQFEDTAEPANIGFFAVKEETPAVEPEEEFSYELAERNYQMFVKSLEGLNDITGNAPHAAAKIFSKLFRLDAPKASPEQFSYELAERSYQMFVKSLEGLNDMTGNAPHAAAKIFLKLFRLDAPAKGSTESRNDDDGGDGDGSEN